MISKAKKVLNPRIVRYYFLRAFGRLVSDKTFLDALYEARFNRKINWDAPQTFTEKMQWLKLYDRKDYYSRLVDKAAAKQIVLEKVGHLGVQVIPTIGVYEHFDDIDFEKMPDAFVLKCTHDSGSVIICKDKNSFDKKAAKKKLEKALKRNLFYKGREFPYRDIPPRIIAEQFLLEIGEDRPMDYKFFCFNGLFRFLLIGYDRETNVKLAYYDANFNRLDIKEYEYLKSTRNIEKPKHFETMKQVAEILSSGIPFLRVDLYNIRGTIYFGEMTFYNDGGFVKYIPEETDWIWGKELQLPEKHG